jgi:hypothetical protein
VDIKQILYEALYNENMLTNLSPDRLTIIVNVL